MDQFASRAGNVLHPKTVLISDIKTLPDHLNKSVLHHKYAILGLSVQQLANEFGVSKAAVLESLKREGIPTRASHKHHGRFSTPPYGFRLLNGRLVKCSEEQKIVGLVVRWTVRDKLSRTAITRKLKAMGFKNRGGHTNWHHETIHLILKRNKKLKTEKENGKNN